MKKAVQRILDSHDTPEAKQSQVWAMVDSATVDAFLFQDTAIARRNRAQWEESGLRNTGAMESALTRRAKERAPLRNRLARLNVPSLVLAGRHDRNVGVEQAREVSRLLPDARLHVFDRSAHFPDLEEPDEFLRVVVPFIAA